MSDLFDDIAPPADPTRQKVVIVAFPADELEHLGFLMQLSPEIAIVQLMRERLDRPSSNGSGAYKHVCSGCGREFDSNRRQLPGKRVWCGRDECRKEAAALRARDYRDRKAKETT